MNNVVVLVSCPDKKGIVAKITEFISVNNGNIEHLDQHIDSQSKTFFMRVEWSMDGFAIPKTDLSSAFKVIADEFRMDYKIHFSSDKARVGVFVSKSSHCLYDILLRVAEGELRCEIPVIISDHKDCEKIAVSFNIPFYYFPKVGGKDVAIEREELKIIEQYDVDILVLARYMKIFSNQIIDKFTDRIINIHHSFLPAFIGQLPYSQAHARGVKIIGATSHYVTEELDAGPIIEQDITRVSHSDDVETLRCKGRDLERVVLSRAIKLHLSQKVLVYTNKTVVFD